MIGMKQAVIIAFVGMPGSGKGTCTDYLSEKHDFPVVHFGQMVYEEVQRRGLHNVDDEKFVREDMRKQDGPAVMAIHAARKAQYFMDKGHSVIVFDGLYSWSEYKYLHEIFGEQLILIAVATPRKERYRRVLARVDSHRKYTSEDQIKDRDISEIENLEKGGPIAFADYTIVNDHDPYVLIDKLELILRELEIIPST